MPHILLADDDLELSDLLVEYLTTQDLTVTPVYDGKAALAALNMQAFDLMVLDIMMPEIDGLTLLRSLPNPLHLPVIMLTAKGDDIDRIIGLELGADDYLGKPCNPRELLARIHAVLKRAQPHDAVSNVDTLPDSLVILDSNQRTCHVGEHRVNLTGTEFDLLYTLLANKAQVVSKETLSLEVLQRELQPFDRSIDVHISRLRKKLAPFHDEPIRSVRGKGYQLTV